MPGPPWIGIRLPPRSSYCQSPSGASSGMFAPRRSVIASARARATVGLASFSPRGVFDRVGWRRTGVCHREVEERVLRARGAGRASVWPRDRVGDEAAEEDGALGVEVVVAVVGLEHGAGARRWRPGRPCRRARGSPCRRRRARPARAREAYWRLSSATVWRLRRLNPLPGRPSVPARRSSTIFRPSRVRSERSVRSSPTIRSKPSSGCLGVGEPVAVVAVRDVVAAGEVGQLRRARGSPAPLPRGRCRDRTPSASRRAPGCRRRRRALPRSAPSRPLPSRRSRSAPSRPSSNRRCPCGRPRSS